MAKAPRASKPAEDGSIPEGDAAPDADTEMQASPDDADETRETPPEPPVAPEPEPMPSRIRLARPHGFIDDDGRRRHWHPGVVSDPDDVAALVGRGVPHEALED